MDLKLINNYEQKTSKFLFFLRNKNYVRINLLNNNYIKISSHEKWFKKFINKKNNKIFIINYNKLSTGYIRIEKKRVYHWISWALLSEFNNKKIMTKSLKKITRNKKIKFKAIIKYNNFASKNVALNAGFNLRDKEKNNLIFQKN